MRDEKSFSKEFPYLKRTETKRLNLNITLLFLKFRFIISNEETTSVGINLLTLLVSAANNLQKQYYQGFYRLPKYTIHHWYKIFHAYELYL